MAIRVERKTRCPMCDAPVTVNKSRPGAIRKKYCERCRTHPQREQYRRAIYKYGISFEECERLFAVENCECCGTTVKTKQGREKGASDARQIDHCHVTGEIRGVLCWECNAGIGKLGDNIEGLERALAYLRKDKP